MKAKLQFCLCFVLSLVLLCCISTACALQSEQPALYDSWWGGMSYSGILNPAVSGLMYDEFGNPYYTEEALYWYDYATGCAVPLCSHLECNHAQPVAFFDDRPFLEKLNDTSICYAWRLNRVPMTGPVMYEGKLYGVSTFPDLFGETHDVDVYEMELDGPARRVASLGHLFSWEQHPECVDFLIYDRFAYLNMTVVKNPDLDLERSEALGDVTPESVLYKVSLDDGQITELCRISGQTCDYCLMGLVDGVLYFSQQIADGYASRAEAASFEAWKAEYEEKLRYSLLGVNTASGELVVLDEALCDMVCAYGSVFDIMKEGCLYAIIPPQTAEEKEACFVAYDLEKHARTAFEPFAYDASNAFAPYYVLTDTTVLAFNFETGEYALRNLQNGEITMLDMPGACIWGNDGEYYDLSAVNAQPEVVLLTHYHADGSQSVAYITIEELLNNGTPRDFDIL